MFFIINYQFAPERFSPSCLARRSLAKQLGQPNLAKQFGHPLGQPAWPKDKSNLTANYTKN
jgi:hypothetical protein